MKRLFTAFVAFSAILSCTQTYILDPDPYVPAPGTCVFKAQVELPEGQWVWDAVHDKVGVYADNLTNAPFQPRAAFDGKSGVIELMGEGAMGQAYAYFPYSSHGEDAVREGRQPLSERQSYQSSAMDQIRKNTTFVATADEDGLLRFRCLCGALHIQVKMQFNEIVQSITLTSTTPVTGWLDITGAKEEAITHPGYSVSITDIGLPCSETSPLDVWVMLPEGNYNGLSITISGATESLSTVIEGTFQLRSGEETSASAKEKKADFDGGYLEGEDVDYD